MFVPTYIISAASKVGRNRVAHSIFFRNVESINSNGTYQVLFDLDF